MPRNLTASPFALLSTFTLFAFATVSSLAQPPMPEPTPEHEGLQNEVGVWDAKIKLWVSPDSDPITGTATETSRMLGKMWVVSDFQGEIMGFPFAGHGQYGYDPQKKKYIGTWVDTNSPHMSLMEGTMDTSKNTLTMISKITDAQTGKVKTSKLVTTFIDQNHKKFEIYDAADDKKGEWKKHMEITYSKQVK